jgi:hypothetical protein
MPLCPQITNTPIDITPVTFAITAVTFAPTTATYAAAGMTFIVGDSITVSDVVPDGFNGTYTVTSVVAATSFTVANTTNKTVTTGTGTAYQSPAGYTLDDSLTVFLTDTVDLADPNLNPAITSAAAAATQAALALTNAATAQSVANTAAAASATALQTSSDTIVNAGHQLTAINATGVTVYAGASPTSGARVVLNATGIAGFNSSGTATFAVNAGTGAVDITGNINATSGYFGTPSNGWSIGPSGLTGVGTANITGGSIVGTQFTSANGTFSVSTAGYLTATAGTIGGFTIAAGGLTYSSLNIYGSGNATIAMQDITRNISFKDMTLFGSTNIAGSATIGTFLDVSGSATISGNLNVLTVGANSGYQPAYWNPANGRFYSSPSSRRYKENIAPLPDADYLAAILKLEPVTYTYKAKFTDTPTHPQFGLVAESVAKIPELGAIVNRNAKGQPDSLGFDRLAIFMIPALRQLNQKIESLQFQLAALETK